MNSLFEIFFNVFMTLWQNIDKLFMPVANFIEEGVETIIPNVLTFITWFFDNMLTFIKFVNDKIDGSLSKVLNYVQSAWEWTKDSFVQLWQYISGNAGSGLGGGGIRPRTSEVILEALKWIK